MPVFKNNIVTPFQTETYWIYNPFLSHMPCLLLIINTIYEVRADLYLHVQGRFCKGEAKVGKKLKTYCYDSSNTEAFRFLRNKSWNKQACDQMTVIYISATPPCSKCYCHLHYWEHDGSQFALCSLRTSKTHTLSSLVVAICIITLLPNPNDAVLT